MNLDLHAPGADYQSKEEPGVSQLAFIDSPMTNVCIDAYAGNINTKNDSISMVAKVKDHAHATHVFTQSAVTRARPKIAVGEIMAPDTLGIPKKKLGEARAAFDRNLNGKIIVINTERLLRGKDGEAHLLGHLEEWIYGNNTLIRQGVPFGQTLVGLGDQPIDIFIFSENPSARKKDAERICNIVRKTNPGVKIIFITSISDPQRLHDIFSDKGEKKGASTGKGEPYDIAYCPSTRYVEKLPRRGKWKWNSGEVDSAFMAGINCLYDPVGCAEAQKKKP